MTRWPLPAARRSRRAGSAEGGSTAWPTPLLGEQPVGRDAGERLARVDDLEPLDPGAEGVEVCPGAGSHVVLGVDVGRGPGLPGELDDVATPDLEPSPLVEARAERIDVRKGRGRRGHRVHNRPIMKHAPPAPPEEIGVHDGLAYALFVPDSEPECGVVILHGAGSAKESHFDFARLCRDSGLVAVAFDARGHGRSEGPLGPGAVDDVLAMCRLIRRYADQVALRGSSMGAFCAIHA